MRVTKTLVPWVAVVGFVACGGGGRAEPLLPASELAERVSPQQAADRIATERCNHEERCSGFGVDREFQSREHCMQGMKTDAAKDLGGDDCRNGVGESDLKECLAEISNQDCSGLGAEIEKVDTYLSCRGANLCLD